MYIFKYAHSRRQNTHIFVLQTPTVYMLYSMWITIECVHSMDQAIECVHSMGKLLNVYIQWLSCGMCRFNG